MAFTEINQQNYLSVINGKVDVPDLPKSKRLTIAAALSAVAGSDLQFKFGRKIFALPTFERTDGYPEDWYTILRDAAS
jgi:hypothetical protein